MSINTLMSNTFILNELKDAIGGDTLAFATPLSRSGDIVSLNIGEYIVNYDSPFGDGGITLNINNGGSVGDLLTKGAGSNDLAWIPNPSITPSTQEFNVYATCDYPNTTSAYGFLKIFLYTAGYTRIMSFASSNQGFQNTSTTTAISAGNNFNFIINYTSYGIPVAYSSYKASALLNDGTPQTTGFISISPATLILSFVNSNTIPPLGYFTIGVGINSLVYF